MIVWIWVRDDESGLLDGEFRDGDIDHVTDDSFEPSIGGLEKKVWLIVKVPDPPNQQRFIDEIPLPEYRPGATASEPNIIIRKRSYRVDWRSKFSASEISIIEDQLQQLPDGTTNGGGTVTAGVVSNLFTVRDFLRK